MSSIFLNDKEDLVPLDYSDVLDPSADLFIEVQKKKKTSIRKLAKNNKAKQELFEMRQSKRKVVDKAERDERQSRWFKSAQYKVTEDDVAPVTRVPVMRGPPQLSRNVTVPVAPPSPKVDPLKSIIKHVNDSAAGVRDATSYAAVLGVVGEDVPDVYHERELTTLPSAPFELPVRNFNLLGHKELWILSRSRGLSSSFKVKLANEKKKWLEKKSPKFQIVCNEACMFFLRPSKNSGSREVKDLALKADMWLQDLNYRSPLPPQAHVAMPLGRGVTTLMGWFDNTLSLRRTLMQERNPHRRAVYSRLVDRLDVIPQGKFPDGSPEIVELQDVCSALNGYLHVWKPKYAVLQGATTSRPAVAIGGLPVTVELPSAPVEDFIAEFLDSHKDCPTISRFVALLVALRESPSWVGWIATISLYLSENKVSAAIEKMIRRVMGRVTAALVSVSFQSDELETEPMVFPESNGSFGDRVLSWTRDNEGPAQIKDLFSRVQEWVWSVDAPKFMSSELGSALWQLLSTLSLVGIVTHSGWFMDPADLQDKVNKFSKIFLFSRDGNVVETFVQRLLRFLAMVADRAYESISTGDYSLFFSSRVTAKGWIDRCRCVLEDECVRLDVGRPSVQVAFEKKLKSGDIPSDIISPLTPGQRISYLRRLDDDATALLARYAGDPRMVFTVSQWRERCVKEAVTLENVKSNGSYRVTPFGVFVYGEPGVGKSFFMQDVHHSLGNHLGMSITEDSTWKFTNGNFMDGYNGQQWMLLMDDIDQGVANPTAGVNTHVQTVISLINSAPLEMEQPRVEDKGKFYANFIAAFYTSNYEHGVLKGYCRNPLAFWRRFPYRLKMTIKAEFANKAGSIDKAKAYVGEALRGDIWNFQVEQYDANNFDSGAPFDKRPYKIIFENLSRADCLAFLSQACRIHYDRELAALLQHVKSTEHNADLCTHCHLPLAGHESECVARAFFQSAEASSLNFGVLAFVVASVFPPLYGLLLILCVWIWSQVPREVWNTAWTWCRGLLFQLAWQAYVGYVWSPRIALLSRFLELTPEGFRKRADALDREWLDAMKNKAMWGSGLVLTALALRHLARHFAPARSDRDRCETEFSKWQGVSETGFSEGRLFPIKDSWERVKPTMVRPYTLLSTPTYTLEDFVAALKARTVMVSLTGATTVRRMRGVRLNAGYVITMRHLFIDDRRDPRSQALEYGGLISISSASFVCSPARVEAVAGRDLVLVYCPELAPLSDGWDILGKLPGTSQTSTKLRADKAIMITGERVLEESPGCQVIAEYGRKGAFAWRDEFDTSVGDCGSPLVAVFGRTFAWVGMHGMEVNVVTDRGPVRYTVSEDVVGLEVGEAIDKLSRRVLLQVEDVCMDLTQLCSRDEVVSFREIRARSSLLVALTHSETLGVEVLGTVVPPLVAGLSKSKCRDTLFRRDVDVQALELEVCGVNDYYVPPVMTGKMEEGRWVDPFTVNLEATLNRGGDYAIWDQAIDDYVTGLDLLVGSDRCLPLTDYETYVGLEGTTTGGTNLQTSAGAPFCSKKNAVLEIDHDRKVVSVHPRLQLQINQILTCVRSGRAYSPAAIFVLKDEAVTKAKNEAHKIRVFNVLPFAFNFLLKKYLGPVLVFMRAHWQFFEVAVGMNLVGDDLPLLLEWLNQVEGDNWMGMDRSFFDVHASTTEELAVVKSIDKIVAGLGYNDDERLITRGLCLSCIYVTNVLKNDVFVTSCRMPTGFWATILFNCLRNVLQSRYAWFALEPTAPLFRSKVRQVVLGDDSLGKVARGQEWYNQVSSGEVLLDVGVVVTSCHKGRQLTPFETMEGVTFLKRCFRKVGGVWTAPIDKKTLVKMLTIYQAGELSEMDHNCVLVSNVLAEAFLWGPVFYRRMRVLAEHLELKYGLVSAQLRIRDYEELMSSYQKGTLCTWDPLRECPGPGVNLDTLVPGVEAEQTFSYNELNN